MMTKAEALKWAGGRTIDLARKLRISHAAVSKWPDDQIPRLREFEIREIQKQEQTADGISGEVQPPVAGVAEGRA